MNVGNIASSPADQSPEKGKPIGVSSTPANKSPGSDAIKLPPSLAAKNDVPIKSPLPRLQTQSEATASAGEDAPALPPHIRNAMFPTADPGSVVSGGGIRYNNHFAFFEKFIFLYNSIL